MLPNIDLIKKILLEENYVSADDFSRAEAYCQKNHLDLLDYLLSEELLSSDLLGQAIAEHYNVSYGDLNTNLKTTEQIKKIPEKIGLDFRVIFFG
jgi:hypothetical protein